MLKRYAVPRRGAALSCALLALALFAVQPATAQAKTPKAAKPTVAKPAPAPKAAKAAKPKSKSDAPKPAKPPEKSFEEQRAEDGPWAKRTNWVSLRAGYAKSTSENGGDGLAGYGIAYQRMLSRKWAFGASVQHDIVGHIANSYEISVPMTVEFTRHFRWNTSLRPYLGVGGGYYFHKYYRTAGDYTGAPGAGTYLTMGANLPVDARHVLGLDTRISFVNGRDGVTNPVFGAEKATETLWSIKLNWGLVY